MIGARGIGAAAAVVLVVASGVAVARLDGGDSRPVRTNGNAARPPAPDGPAGRSGAVAAATSTSAAAPVAPAEPAASASAPALTSYGDCRRLVSHVQDQSLDHVTAWGLAMPGATAMPGSGGMAVADSAAGASAGSAAEGSPAHSTTNVQEAGVDEPDLVKNDAGRAFTAFGGILRAVDIGGGDARVTDEMDLGLPGAIELLLAGERVVALAWDGGFLTRVVIVDVGDLDHLREVARIEIEGAYVSARHIGDAIRLVVTQNGPAFDFVHPQSDDEREVARALAHNRDEVRSTALAEWLPDVTTVGGSSLVPAPRCRDTYVTPSFAGPGSTTVVTLSPSEGAVLDATAVLATASEVYSTTDHLYVATSAWAGPTGSVTTEVHRFDISDPRRSVYEASGSVAGHLLQPPWFVGPSNLGQWALSEHDGDLRIATTVSDGAGMSNAVTIVRRAADVLAPIGVLGGLGVNEQLYAVRFMGPRAYVVTYRKVDPLYVLDLSDPAAPRVAGELKVPGYSAYLHPVGEGLLLGIGQADDDEDGLADGAKVSLFDVADPTAPRELATVRLGERGSLTGVEADHRTFTWWPDPSRAVLTMTNWEDRSRFQGAIALDVQTAGISEVGRIEHRDEDGRCAEPIVRSRVVGDALLTFSAIGIDAHALTDLDPRSSMRYGAATATCGEGGFAGDR